MNFCTQKIQVCVFNAMFDVTHDILLVPTTRFSFCDRQMCFIQSCMLKSELDQYIQISLLLLRYNTTLLLSLP